MKELLQSIVAAHPGFLELRYHRRVQNSFFAQKGRVEDASSRTRAGVGVRALVDGAWGFSSTSDLSRDGIDRAVDRAVTAARDLARADGRKIAPLPPTTLARANHVGDDFDTLLAQPLGDKLSRVMDLERATRESSSRIHTASSMYAEIFEEKSIVTTDGAAASYRIVRPELRVAAFAEKDGAQVVGRNSVGVQGGWNCLFNHQTAQGIAERTAKQAVDQLDAPHVPGGVKTVILAPSIVGLLSHEAIGHTVEADFVLAGSVAAGKIGRMVASEHVTLCDSANSEYESGACGTLPFDDEGVPAQRTTIIQNGRLVSYLHNRETAAEFGVAPTGNARAWEYSDEPLVRMRNTYIEPGTMSLDEMIAGVEDGYLLDNPGSGQADATGEFMFGAGYAIEIKHGRLGRIFREVTISGVAFEMLRTVDAVSREFRWDLGSGYCGKWQPAKVDAGGPYLRCQVMLGGRQ
ncbi:MAG: TldD/PmbA family protein [Candidatus Eisenbacteria bacterium]|nr:TldD/PmbA family protein [Candidatus Eisenbacteria bacterium]